jgi:predicted helicase
LGKQYGAQPSAEDLAAYIYSVLGGQSYTQRFWNELETPGPRVPLTKDGTVFAAAAALGRRLLWLHTYAERFLGKERGDEVPAGLAKSIKGISSDPMKYPEKFSYEETTREILVGDGRFGPVDPQVWEFELSGLKVVQSWLGYRMKKRAGKKSSALDDIRPDHWTPQMTDEFLELLWVLEWTLSMEPELSAMLDKISTGSCFKVADLPSPTEAQREAPALALTTGDLLEIMEADNDDDADDEFNT